MTDARDVSAGPGDEPDAPQPVRCQCNKLVGIRYGDVIEIKCNKCKRMIEIHTRGIERIEIH